MIEEREEIEWTNTWIDKANTNNSRILFIGDSVTRQLRSELSRFLFEELPVDLYASSYALNDAIFWTSVEQFLNSGYTYEIIIIHYGFHHGFSTMCSSSHDNYLEYKGNYQKLIDLCKLHSKRIVVMTGTSYVCKNNLSEIDEEWEEEVLTRNSISKELAGENNIQLFDMYQLISHSRGEFKYIDHVHLERKADIFIIYQLLLSLLKADTHDFGINVFENLNESFTINNNNVSIYGKGIDGIRNYYRCKGLRPEVEIISWYETVLKDDIKTFMGLPIRELSDYKEGMIIISSIKYADEMEQELIKRGIKNYLRLKA